MPLDKNSFQIPHHAVVRFLGRGALGDVWMLRGPGGVHKAAKFIRLEFRNGVKEFMAIQRIKRIRHAHLAQITDVWLLDDEGKVIPDDDIDRISARLSSNDRKNASKATLIPDLPSPSMLVMAMTLADKNLFDLLNECLQSGQSGIPYDDLMRYMQEAAKGLDFLNQPHPELEGKSIQHCDVKPQNMLLVGGSVQICDFGLSRMVGERRTTNQMEGTLAYIAPEAARGQDPTPSTDQYSLAISYYELRTGRVPFNEEATAYEILQVHTLGKLDFSLVGEAEQKVLRRATSLDPAKRFPSNRAFVDALLEANAPAKEAGRRGLYALLGLPLILVALVSALLYVAMVRRAPLVELPPDFAPVAGTSSERIGGRSYPLKIERVLADGERVTFVLIHEPLEEQLFYIMENKVWNGLFRKFAEQHPDQVKRSDWLLGGKRVRAEVPAAERPASASGDPSEDTEAEAASVLEDIGADDPRLPVLRVHVDDAHRFAVWLVGSQKGRLPSVKQWDTAAGAYRPNLQQQGPFLTPYAAGEIAVDRDSLGPLPVGTAVKDISPFGVRDMAGNGNEFTRDLPNERQQVPFAHPDESTGILTRGRSYAPMLDDGSSEGPLLYSDLKEDHTWLYIEPRPYIGFRVVLEKVGLPLE